MALNVTNLNRQFFLKQDGKNKDIELNDPNGEMSPEEVMKFYSGKYPELTNATIVGPKVEGNKAVYSFKTIVGTKG